MSKEATKKAADELLALCAKERVKIPTDEKNAKVAAVTMIIATKENNEFQIQNALKDMIAKYGQDEKPVNKKKRKSIDKDEKPSKTKKKSIQDIISIDQSDNEDDEDEEEHVTKKPKRSGPKALVEKNQPLAEAFRELSGFEFKAGEKFKGGTWSKVAKAIRESEVPITSGKQALKLKGIGKSSAAKIDEFLETGTLEKLEEFRKGNI